MIGVEMAIAKSSIAKRPTKVRWGIMACVVMVTVLTYLDRLNLGIAGKYIQDELSLSTHLMGWIFSAFLLGYSLLQVPAGWAGDRYGPKNILTGAILLWSLFTALTGLAPGPYHQPLARRGRGVHARTLPSGRGRSGEFSQ